VLSCECALERLLQFAQLLSRCILSGLRRSCLLLQRLTQLGEPCPECSRGGKFCTPWGFLRPRSHIFTSRALSLEFLTFSDAPLHISTRALV
jgi:hypothetical protein